MKILGVNAGRAAPPRLDEANSRPLADGSAALLTGGVIACTAIEERHAKKRYAGGFRFAAPAVLRAADVAFDDLDAIGFSTCCDSIWAYEDDIVDAVAEDLCVDELGGSMRRDLRRRVYCVDHHDSHAMLSFVGSGFARALVCTVDGFGNRRSDVDHFHVDAKWWQGSFDRQTFYLAEWRDGKVRMERVLEASTGAEDVGLAELYRAVTHYLGWSSYQYAGKTMALAGYGDAGKLSRVTFIDEASGEVCLANNHADPIAQIETALRRAGYEPPKDLKRPASPRQAWFANVAARLQSQLEASLHNLVGGLVDKLGVSHVAFGGGLAMNCVAMGKLACARPDLEFYVPPAPGDTGQGLGNALWLSHSYASPISVPSRRRRLDDAALGVGVSIQSAEAALERLRTVRSFEVHQPQSTHALARAVSDLVASGRVVAVCVGRSEYGPRALGCRSILADARDPEVKAKVNRVKRREGFRPFAASVLADDVGRYYAGAVQSPFMSFALQATDVTREAAPGIVHVDGSTRIQTVKREESLLSCVLEAFREQTGVGLMLNTSFNLAGEPMVESSADAVDVFLRSEIDALVLGPYLVTRRQWNEGGEHE